MKRNNVTILILFLVAIFLVFFAWFLHTTCRRVVSAEVHEMLYQRDLEAQKSTDGDGKATCGIDVSRYVKQDGTSEIVCDT
ncbi:hypothetical protein HBH53_187560 [Parastagonospora nodorum]|nr:hypothetical protein HBH53_187560 [Parastagonospora nodorum]KAH4982206.1 hypothetical protein HBI76_160900 [Parastagonospora nodorum]KAH5178628.1 hypothetical protein HBH76_192470 [Parastagonospora nodorum]KAH5505832.1 hypothetical protein HBI52_148860 [Parastagonospora nodorum]KAH6329364.1 hypothetical protein HBI37_194740 [Parastagonospora nodorum]